MRHTRTLPRDSRGQEATPPREGIAAPHLGILTILSPAGNAGREAREAGGHGEAGADAGEAWATRRFVTVWREDLLELRAGDAASLPLGTAVELLTRHLDSRAASPWRRLRGRLAAAEAAPGGGGSGSGSGVVRGLDDIFRLEGLGEAEHDPLRRDVDALLQSPFLHVLEPAQLAPLLARLSRRRLSPGAFLMRQGEPGESLSIIQSGVCRVQVEKDGRLYEEARLGPGEIVGETAVFTGDTRNASVVAEEPMVVWELRAADFEDLCASAPMARHFLTELIQHRLESAAHPADRLVGRYRIQATLGQGGYALVYSGVHDVLGLPVAIKMLKHTLAMDPEFVATFRREAQVIARLNHPNIVRVYDIEERHRTIFIIMERLEGRSLKEELKRQGRLAPAQVADVLFQICQGLEYAHGQGIVHRDIKPANLFLPLFGPVKILDFGLACTAGLDDRCFQGTAAYMAPEQIRGEALDPRTDLYALGVTAFELLTGQLPFQSEDLLEMEALHLHAPFPDLQALAPWVPEALAAFVHRCVAKTPEARHPDARAAREALRGLVDGACPVPRTARCLLTVHCLHDETQRQALQALLQEFTQKAQSLGVKLRASEFLDV